MEDNESEKKKKKLKSGRPRKLINKRMKNAENIMDFGLCRNCWEKIIKNIRKLLKREWIMKKMGINFARK